MTITSAIQKRVFEILSAGMPQPVYDFVPAGTPCPYVEVGDDIVTDLSNKTDDHLAVLLTIHCWSEARGRREVRDMCFAARGLLHDIDLGIPDQTAISRCQQVQTFRDEDGLTHHGIVSFRILV